MRDDLQVQVAVEYLRARARAEAPMSEVHPDALMLTKAAELLIAQKEALTSLRERNVVLQRQVGEYECREMQG
jgi:chromosomal replication initiation ATPase DnaA